MSLLIGITTFKKSQALDVLIKSIRDLGYTNDIVVADDNCNKPDPAGLSAGQVCSKHTNIKLVYNDSASQLGVARNKNRLLKEFFNNAEKYDGILLLDDDIKLVSPNLESHLNKIKETGLKHVSGFWTDEAAYHSNKLIGLSGKQWSDDFPPLMTNQYVSYHKGGCQGCLIWVDKELAEKAGYFKKFPTGYGGEHSEYSARLNMLSGWAPDLFPMLLKSSKFFHGQNIPNNYNINRDNIERNLAKYREYLEETSRGVELKYNEHNLPKKERKIEIV